MTRPRNRWRRRRHQACRPNPRFTPYAWAKLLFLRDAGPTEVGGFGVSTAEDLLLIEDIRLVRQSCTRTSVLFDDEAVADHFDACVDAGMSPERFARVWIHTHPGSSAEPSHTDEQTFARVFSDCDWAVMAILAREGECYSRIRFGAGPGGELRMPMDVSYDADFAAVDFADWALQHHECVSTSIPKRHGSVVASAEPRHLAAANAELHSLSGGGFDRAEFADVPVSDPEAWEIEDDDSFYLDE